MVQEHDETDVGRRLDALEEQVGVFQDLQHAQTSLATDALHQSNLADLPTTGVRNGALAWVKDGRKFSEGSGDGTGVLSYFDEAAGTWLLFGDDSEVQA